VDNLVASDYALVVRGDANSSVRFYEALSLGRIPLFLDTACVLPLEAAINYRDFCVFVDWRDIDRIGEKLLEFHRSLAPERFEDMQRKARTAYEEYLRIDAFSKRLATLLRARVPAV
jgi:glycosyltransferase involved in cell wall biosynthesis